MQESYKCGRKSKEREVEKIEELCVGRLEKRFILGTSAKSESRI